MPVPAPMSRILIGLSVLIGAKCNFSFITIRSNWCIRSRRSNSDCYTTLGPLMSSGFNEPYIIVWHDIGWNPGVLAVAQTANLPAKGAIPSSRWLQIPNQSEIFYIDMIAGLHSSLTNDIYANGEIRPTIDIINWWPFLPSTIFCDKFFDTTSQRGRVPGSVAMYHSMSDRLPMSRPYGFWWRLTPHHQERNPTRIQSQSPILAQHFHNQFLLLQLEV